MQKYRASGGYFTERRLRRSAARQGFVVAMLLNYGAPGLIY
jgi:hypothetical protein